MAIRKVLFLPNHYYHIYNRGAHKADIFRDDRDYVYLLKLLKEKAVAFDVSVIAYCLMDIIITFCSGKTGMRPSVNSCRLFSIFTRKRLIANMVYQEPCLKAHSRRFSWIGTNIFYSFVVIFIAIPLKRIW